MYIISSDLHLLFGLKVSDSASHKINANLSFMQGKGKKLIGTFSATDLRGCPISFLQSCLRVPVLEFTERTSTGPVKANSNMVQSSKELVTCFTNSSVLDVIDKAVDGHVHRVWVVDQHGLLVGIVSLTDILRVLRSSSLLVEAGT